MLLNNLLIKKPEDVFIHLERKVNNERFMADVSEDYTAYGPADGFELPFVLIDKKNLTCFEINPDPKLINILQEDNMIKFFIHPEMIPSYKNRSIVDLLDIQGSVYVSPTSSTRTVITRGRDYPFMIKIDLERKIGDGVKKLKDIHLQHIRKMGVEFQKISLNKFGYLPESFGAVFSCNDYEVGMIVREFYTKPKIKDETYLLPFFSLFSKDESSKDDLPLLLQIIKNLNKKGCNEIDICFDEIITPYLEAWSCLVLQRGLNAEMHAQNTLLEIDKNGTPIRVVYRDLQDTFVDLDIRSNKGLNTNFDRNIIGKNERGYIVEGTYITDREKCKQISYSLTYDYRIGRALDYFIVTLGASLPAAEAYLVSLMKETWKKYFEGTNIFSSKAYCLQKNQRDIGKELNFLECKPKYR